MARKKKANRVYPQQPHSRSDRGFPVTCTETNPAAFITEETKSLHATTDLLQMSPHRHMQLAPAAKHMHTTTPPTPVTCPGPYPLDLEALLRTPIALEVFVSLLLLPPQCPPSTTQLSMLCNPTACCNRLPHSPRSSATTHPCNW